MGGCFSSSSAEPNKPSANVVSAAGELRLYPLPVTVADVLRSQIPGGDFFLCSSDCLNFDDYIPSLSPGDELEPAQIYFVLPEEKLKYRLAAADMAALAVKASVALDQINASNRRRKSKTRIAPVMASDEIQDRRSNQTVNNRLKIGDRNNNNKPPATAAAGLGISRSGSVRRLTRYSSRRAKWAVRSFRNKLSTIHEGSACDRPTSFGISS